MLKGVHLTLLMGPVVASPVPKEVIDALQSVQVTTSVGARSGFQLSFSLGKNSNFEKVLIPAGFFDPMIRVIVIVTLNGTPSVIMDGVITRQQVTASNEAGKSTFTVTGEDVSAAMDLIDFSGIPYPAMPAEARVALCIAKYAMFGIIPVIIPSILNDAEPRVLRDAQREVRDVRHHSGDHSEHPDQRADTCEGDSEAPGHRPRVHQFAR